MRFHPVVAIFLGFIVYEILRIIAAISFELGFDIVLVPFIIALGGFIATHFSKEQKIRYGLIEGICIAIYMVINDISIGNINVVVMVLSIFTIIFALIGGIIGKKGFNNLYSTHPPTDEHVKRHSEMDFVVESAPKNKAGNGYLVCNKCEGYYELQNRESPDDFTDECECGGNLEYRDTL